MTSRSKHEMSCWKTQRLTVIIYMYVSIVVQIVYNQGMLSSFLPYRKVKKSFQIYIVSYVPWTVGRGFSATKIFRKE